jgi:hypothetical protein
MFHRQTAASVGYYDSEFDNENPLWYRLLSVKKGAVLGETLYYNRWLMGSVSRSRVEHWTIVHQAVRDKYDLENARKLKSRMDPCARKAFRKKLKETLVVYLRAGDRDAALRLAWSGWKADPFSTIRTKQLLYAVLGIEMVRIYRRRDQNSGLVRCPSPLLSNDKLSFT